MAEIYQQFLLKLSKAYEKTGEDKPWTVYENVFGKVKNFREYIFLRILDKWADIDDLSIEESLSELMAKAYGENEAIKWLQIVQKATESVETQVLSRFEQF